ncbi:MAG: TonB-dependent receptor plug domain-containing protein [Bacteroidales bacterium]|nr:TonB-dependent receptor plug domain-containing protein [Bacteroidales bacterium]
MSKIRIITLIMLIVATNTLVGQNVTIFGHVTDSTNGEFLIGAHIVCLPSNVGIVTNNYGNFSIQIPSGSSTLMVSYIGYTTFIKPIISDKNIECNISLIPEPKNIDEVVILANNNSMKISTPETGLHSLKQKDFDNIPSVGGIPDVLKSLQLLPGVQTTNEGTTGLSIRGGALDQNLILVDEAPIYNPAHILGIFSAINTKMVKEVVVYKGDFPEKYGGRASSVIDVRLRDGNNQEFLAEADVGILGAGLICEGPIVKGKSSFIVAGRVSYAGFVANCAKKVSTVIPIYSLNDFHSGNNVYFYDINGKINYKINSKNTLYLSVYNGFDYFYARNVNDLSTLDWGNTTMSLRWNRRSGSRIFSNTSLIYSGYNFNNSSGDFTSISNWSSTINNFNLKYDVDYYPNSNNHVSLGAGVEYMAINPGELHWDNQSSQEFDFSLPIERTIQPFVYIGNEQKISNWMILNYGIRFSTFGTLGNKYVYSYENEVAIDSVWLNKNEFEKNYVFIEPRLTVAFNMRNNSSIKASYTRVNQGIHRINNTSVSLPTDVWVPSGKNIEPIVSDMFSVGYYLKPKNNNTIISLELYYKEQQNITDYIDNADLQMNKHIATQLRQGNAEALGFDIMLKRENERLNGWISYGYSYIEHQINEINEGEVFYPRYHKPHNLSVVINFKYNPRVSFNAVFKYNSGGFITLPEGTFFYRSKPFSYYTERNGYELPAYHRLDIGMKYISKKNKARKWKAFWDFGIYNVYNRKNAFSIYTETSWLSLNVTKMYIFGATPYITYTIKF